MSTWSSTDKVFLSDIWVTNISQSFTYKMAAKTSCHIYGTKLCHCHPMYSKNTHTPIQRPFVRDYQPGFYWSKRQWHQLGCMQVWTSLQRDNHASTPPLKIFTGRMPFLLPNQQHQSTEGRAMYSKNKPIKQKLWVEVQATNRLDVGRKMPCIQSQWRRLDTEFIHRRHAMHFPRLVDHAYTALHTAA